MSSGVSTSVGHLPWQYSETVRSLVVLVALVLVAPARGGGRRAAEGADEEGPGDGEVHRPQALATSAPGFTATKRPGDEPLPKGARCDALDEGDLTVTGDANSPDFKLATGGVFVTVGSSAHVYRTLGDANTSWRRGTSKQTLTCLGDIVRLSAAPGQKITIVSSKQVAFPALAPKTSAYRARRDDRGGRQSAGPRVRRRDRAAAREDPVRPAPHVARQADRRRGAGSPRRGDRGQDGPQGRSRRPRGLRPLGRRASTPRTGGVAPVPTADKETMDRGGSLALVAALVGGCWMILVLGHPRRTAPRRAP